MNAHTRSRTILVLTAVLAVVVLVLGFAGLNQVQAKASIETTNATVGGTAFYDVNGNGSLEDGEPGIEGVVVELNGTMTTTTSVWNYRFYDLSPGEYTVEVVGGIPDFMVLTTPMSHTVDLQSGDEVVNLNFGFRLNPELQCSDLQDADIWSPPNHGEQYYPVPDGQYGPVTGDDVVYNIYDGEGFGIRVQCLCPDDPDEPAVMTTYLVTGWMSQELINSASAENWFKVIDPGFYQVGWQEGGTLLARNTDNNACLVEPQVWLNFLPLITLAQEEETPACPVLSENVEFGFSPSEDEIPNQWYPLGSTAYPTQPPGVSVWLRFVEPTSGYYIVAPSFRPAGSGNWQNLPEQYPGANQSLTLEILNDAQPGFLRLEVFYRTRVDGQWQDCHMGDATIKIDDGGPTS